ncbi:MAG: glycerate kinase [Marinilabiliaceae bacterium]
MKVLIAPDAFKGSLSAKQVADALKNGLLDVDPRLDCTVFPLADGGEGTIDLIAEKRGAEVISESVPDALGNKIEAKRGRLRNGKTAVIELAQASGITSLSRDHPAQASTYGTGLQIRRAIEEGADEIILTLGGSATVDGGTGIMQALGAMFYQGEEESKPYQNHLYHFHRVDLSALMPEAFRVKWLVLADVNNLLTGHDGGIRIYGPQKGFTDAAIEKLENKLLDWTAALGVESIEDFLDQRGMGAAGGAALPIAACFGADICNGFEWISNNLGLEKLISRSDVIISGEGKIDRQTLMGKGPGQVARLAEKFHKPVIGVCGSAQDNVAAFHKIYSLSSGDVSLDDLMNSAGFYIRQVARDIGTYLSSWPGV